LLSAPQPLPHSTHWQAVLPSCLSFPTCKSQGSVTPGAAPAQGWAGDSSACWHL